MVGKCYLTGRWSSMPVDKISIKASFLESDTGLDDLFVGVADNVYYDNTML